MARSYFKERVATVVAPHMERATYLYATGIMTAGLILFWRPIPIVLWQATTPQMIAFSAMAFLVVVAVMLAAIHQIGHFRFFGLAQAWSYLRGRRLPDVPLVARGLYGLSRHPISICWILLPWITPQMTVSRLIFCLSLVIYILVATRYEENDLMLELGDSYRVYSQRVPRFLPFFRRQLRNDEVRTKSATQASRSD